MNHDPQIKEQKNRNEKNNESNFRLCFKRRVTRLFFHCSLLKVVNNRTNESTKRDTNVFSSFSVLFCVCVCSYHRSRMWHTHTQNTVTLCVTWLAIMIKRVLKMYDVSHCLCIYISVGIFVLFILIVERCEPLFRFWIYFVFFLSTFNIQKRIWVA